MPATHGKTSCFKTGCLTPTRGLPCRKSVIFLLGFGSWLPQVRVESRADPTSKRQLVPSSERIGRT